MDPRGRIAFSGESGNAANHSRGTGQYLVPLTGLRVRIFFLVKSTRSINRHMGHVPYHNGNIWWERGSALLSFLLCYCRQQRSLEIYCVSFHCSSFTIVTGELVNNWIHLTIRNVLISTSSSMGKVWSYPLFLSPYSLTSSLPSSSIVSTYGQQLHESSQSLLHRTKISQVPLISSYKIPFYKA